MMERGSPDRQRSASNGRQDRTACKQTIEVGSGSRPFGIAPGVRAMPSSARSQGVREARVERRKSQFAANSTSIEQRVEGRRMLRV